MATMQLRRDNLTWQVLSDDLVVLDLHGSVYLKLNGSGKVLWEALEQPATEEQLVAVLVASFGIDEGRAAADVSGFVATLRTRNLLDS